jgi:hypothetical protein
MNHNRFISTAILLILLGTTLPAFAQKGEEQKGGGGKAPQAQRQAQPQRTQQAQRQSQPQRTQQAQRQAQPQRTQQAQRQAQPQRTQQAQRQSQPQRTQQARQSGGRQQQTAAYNNRGNNGSRGNRNNGGQYGRISNANYSAHFGEGHSFHMGRPEMVGGYNRFQYGGYSFGYNEAWPVGWDYNDDVYVEYTGDNYYMYNRRHPGFHISLNMFGDGNYGNHYGRISDDHYRAHFGHDHSFRLGRPQFIDGYNRFRYGGYSFGYNQGWPVDWDYNDDFYVEYIDGAYYMVNLRHPGFRLRLNML